MKKRTGIRTFFLAIAFSWIITPGIGSAGSDPPASVVKLIFIHHSTGGNWLAAPNAEQPYGGLGAALMNNNYFVSATNYGWGPEDIGDRTDIPNWPEWFTGSNSGAILAALYAETGQNIEGYGSWPRLATDPGGENRIILFKSCFPNSDLFGEPDDLPGEKPNDQYTVSNAKAVYNNLLTYFQTRRDKLFVVVAAPPLNRNDYASDYQSAEHRAANARAFNNWLVNDWLVGYPYDNVCVFDYFNVLTGENNHHRYFNGAVQHVTATENNFAAYPNDEWDSHPNTAGHSKATEEFVPLLNYYYNRFNTLSELYVSSDDDCGSKSPCYSSIQEAIADAGPGSVIFVKQGTYEESLTLEIPNRVSIKGGYNDAYDQQTANKTIIQGIGQTTIQAPNGSLTFQMLTIKMP